MVLDSMSAQHHAMFGCDKAMQELPLCQVLQITWKYVSGRHAMEWGHALSVRTVA